MRWRWQATVCVYRKERKHSVIWAVCKDKLNSDPELCIGVGVYVHRAGLATRADLLEPHLHRAWYVISKDTYAAQQQYNARTMHVHERCLRQVWGAPVGLRSADMPLTAASRW